MIITGRGEVGAMRTRLRIFVAFNAGIFLVTHTTTLTVPCRVGTVQFSIPGQGVAVRLHNAMARRTVFLLGVTLGAISGI
mgnify:FL=1